MTPDPKVPSGPGAPGASPAPHVLAVTSAGASPGAVVPVLAAVEAAGMRLRAIDVGGAGGGGGALTDRVRRALLGESAERRLKKELAANPPDVAIAFDPHAAMSLTVARDEIPNPAPVIGVCGELEPAREWAQTDCDRVLAIDADAAVALADAGVEPDRILVVGAFGERAFADAGAEDRGAIRARHALAADRIIAIEVAGLGPEVTGQIALQLSLWSAAERALFLFDAAGDPSSASVLRSQAPILGLRAKLFGATSDAAMFYRAAEVMVARPRPQAVARAALVGARLVALVDDTVPGGARLAAALEGRRRGAAVKTPLLLSTALDALADARPLDASPDGADAAADVLWVIAHDKRTVVEERRAAARQQTTEKIRSATAAASAAAKTTAMPGDLEDLGGRAAPSASAPTPTPPSRDEVQRLRAEARLRLDQLNQSMLTARTDAADSEQKASHARGRGDDGSARIFQQKADAARSRMHGLLGEMATLERELAQLEVAAREAEAAGPPPPPPRAFAPEVTTAPPPRDPLADLKRKAGKDKKVAEKNVDDELAALKRKMADKKKPPGK